jgi:protein involved in temperature-dependent protein secretion
MTNPELSREQLFELFNLQGLWSNAQADLRLAQDVCQASTGIDLVDALRKRARAGEAAAAAASNYFNTRASFMEAAIQTQESSDV